MYFLYFYTKSANITPNIIFESRSWKYIYMYQILSYCFYFRIWNRPITYNNTQTLEVKRKIQIITLLQAALRLVQGLWRRSWLVRWLRPVPGVWDPAAPVSADTPAVHAGFSPASCCCSPPSRTDCSAIVGSLGAGVHISDCKK